MVLLGVQEQTENIGQTSLLLVHQSVCPILGPVGSLPKITYFSASLKSLYWLFAEINA